MPDADLLCRLRDAIAIGECRTADDDRAAICTGIPALDRALPWQGFASSSIIELLDSHAGSGAQTLAALFARARCCGNGTLVVLDRERQLYPPAILAWGFAPQQLLIIHPVNEADELWAAVQALRSRSVAAVWLRRDHLKSHDFRRLCLAAETGDTLGLLLRPTQVRGQPTWADVQLVVQPQPSQRGRALQIEVTRCRGGSPGAVVEVDLDDTAGFAVGAKPDEAICLPAISSMVDSAAARPSPGIAQSSFAALQARCTPS